MPEKKKTIKVFSESEDISFIKNLLNRIDLDDKVIAPVFSNKFYFENNEILLFHILRSDSHYFNLLAEDGNIINNKVFFVCSNENALVMSRIVKLGFKDIFILPDEEENFISQLKSYLMSINNKENINLKPSSDFEEIIGESKGIKKIKDLAKKVLEHSSSNILILGETGTGKGLLAKVLHKNSPNNESHFVDIICSAIPENLLESELFGYEQGAFTNALNLKPGLFEIAGNGTLFLDEIGDLTLSTQSKLLRVIEKKVIRRLGGLEDIPVNARIISATNRDLYQLVKSKYFREDLFHRLNIISFILPPLRERKEDILLLAEYFIKYFNKIFNRNISKIDIETSNFLLDYKWPGNIRELKNVIERAVLISDEKILRMDYFQTLVDYDFELQHKKDNSGMIHPYLLNLTLNCQKTSLKNLNRLFANEVFRRMNMNKSKTSKILGISRPKLDELLK